MAFTDNCDVYLSVDEGGVNLTIQHIMRQRPSLFNYATQVVANDRGLWCEPVEFTSDVAKYENPIFTQLPPIPFVGLSSPPVGLDFCAQVTEVQVDFHPGNTIKLPDELNPPLEDQHFALHLQVCVGINCPSPDLLAAVKRRLSGAGLSRREPNVPEPKRMECFCLDVYVTGHFDYESLPGGVCLLPWVDTIDVVGLDPEGLEEALTCYIKTWIDLLVLENLRVPLQFTKDLSQPGTPPPPGPCPESSGIGGGVLVGKMKLILTPAPSPPVANNPAVEDDQLKIFVNLQVM